MQTTQAKGSLRVRPTGVGARRETVANGNGFSNYHSQNVHHHPHAAIPEGHTSSFAPSPNLYNNLNSGSVKSNLNHLPGVHTRSSAAAAAAEKDRRRSNVVKEVDKIKKQREERREQQGETADWPKVT